MPGFPVIPLISTVENAGDAPQFDADHWVANLRNPVRFSDAIAAAGATHATFIEISPHPLLTKAISDTLDDPEIGNKHHHSLGTLQRDANDTVAFHTALNATFTVRPPRRRAPAGAAPGAADHTVAAHPALARLHSRVAHRGSGARAATGRWPPGTARSRRTGCTNPPGRAARCPTARPHARRLVAGARGRRAGRRAGRHAGADPTAAVDNVLFAPAARRLADRRRGGLRDVQRGAAHRHRADRAAVSRRKLYFLTRNAQPVVDGDRANPVHAVLWGLGRTLALEHPEIWGGVIDVDESMPAVLAARHVRDEAAAGDGEDQVVYRSGARHVPRLEPSAPDGIRRRADQGRQPPRHRGHRPHRPVPDPAARRHGRRNDRRGVPQPRRQAERPWPATRLRRGTTLVEVAADVTDENAMAALFDRFGTDLPALEGIYLAAFAGGPVTLADMTDDDVNTMFRPKLDALGVLHALSLRTDVRHFVLFSSISGLLGSRWLAHYTATSTFLDTFAYARRNLGLPATVVNWGLWKSLSDQQTDAGEVMSNAGLEPMADEVAIRALPLVMGPGAPVRPPSSTRTGRCWPRPTAPAERCASSMTCWPGGGRRGRRLRRASSARQLRECPPERRRETAGRPPRHHGRRPSSACRPARRSIRKRDSSNSAWIR